MARVSQFVLFACIAIMCSFSDALPTSSEDNLEIPLEIQDLEKDNYMEEYIDKLLRNLTPKERNILKNRHQIDVKDREGNCNYFNTTKYPRKAIGTDSKTHYIINSRTNQVQPVDFQVCNGKKDRKDFGCEPEENKSYYHGCCVQKKEKIKMFVVPQKYINNKDTATEIINSIDTATNIKGMIEQEVYLPSLCDCKTFATTHQNLYLSNEKQCRYQNK